MTMSQRAQMKPTQQASSSSGSHKQVNYNFAQFKTVIKRLQEDYSATVDNNRKSEYRMYSEKLKSHPLYLSDIDRILTEMLNAKLYPDAFIFSQVIKKLGASRQLP